LVKVYTDILNSAQAAILLLDSGS
jgi:alkanesulfonate monooxygenase SsuD/methylene tetrahydromethanopterin reductase-like flavin-dependent oxidoreductase (luciferase family)